MRVCCSFIFRFNYVITNIGTTQSTQNTRSHIFCGATIFIWCQIHLLHLSHFLYLIAIFASANWRSCVRCQSIDKWCVIFSRILIGKELIVHGEREQAKCESGFSEKNKRKKDYSMCERVRMKQRLNKDREIDRVAENERKKEKTTKNWTEIEKKTRIKYICHPSAIHW